MSEPRSELPRPAMTVDAFLVSAADRPGRFELIDGRLHAMAPERVGHGRVKGWIYQALARAIASAGLTCEVLPAGMTVRIDRTTAFEPDALVYCGARLPGDALEVPEPVIVVEVISQGPGHYDTAGKFAGYFGLPGLHHYLVVDPDSRFVIHHRRNGAEIATRILKVGMLRLDPPGLDVAVDAMVGPG